LSKADLEEVEFYNKKRRKIIEIIRGSAIIYGNENVQVHMD